MQPPSRLFSFSILYLFMLFAVLLAEHVVLQPRNGVTMGEPSAVGSLMSGEMDEEKKRLQRQRLRSVAIALGLGFLVLLFYAATIVRMGGQMANQVTN